MKEEIKKMPKIELHLHLDGSISLELASELSGLSKEKLKLKMVAPNKCVDLKDYLKRFTIPIELMQTMKNLELVAKDLIKQLEEDNVVYAEIRFAPMFHTKNGLTYDEIIKSVLKGLKSEKVKTNLILCMMRGASEEDNIKTIKYAYKYYGKGVCGLDLAGDEKNYPLTNYIDLLKNISIPFTIHAGEVGTYEEVKTAILLGAKRIGHGIHSISDYETLNLIKEKGILLEICPTSNIQTNAIDDIKNHPINELNRMVDVSINTDNRTVSNTTLSKEYELLIKEFNFTIDELKMLNINALNHSFLSKKEEILKRL